MSGPGAGGGDDESRAALGEALTAARSLVVADLAATGQDGAAAVDVVEDAAAQRAWWVEQWPAGAGLVAGLVAQDVQERLAEELGVRWPLCPGTPACDGADPHELRVEPDLGEDPRWVCEEGAVVLAPLGGLPRPTTR